MSRLVNQIPIVGLQIEASRSNKVDSLSGDAWYKSHFNEEEECTGLGGSACDRE